jgi:hypothetical protein
MIRYLNLPKTPGGICQKLPPNIIFYLHMVHGCLECLEYLHQQLLFIPDYAVYLGVQQMFIIALNVLYTFIVQNPESIGASSQNSISISFIP